MTHGDDNGLVLPPAVAPIQVMVIPIAMHKEGVLEKANEVCDRLKKICRAKIDASENSPGWKFAEYEMKGVPIRVEIGPKDIENNQCVIVTRHNREKTFVSLDELETVIPQKLQEVRDGLYEAALETESAAHTPAKRLTKSPKRLKRTATALSRQCGAAARNAKARLRSLRELARAAFRLIKSKFQTPAFVAESLQSICSIGAKLIDNPYLPHAKPGGRHFNTLIIGKKCRNI